MLAGIAMILIGALWGAELPVWWVQTGAATTIAGAAGELGLVWSYLRKQQ